ncbi:hypothetical protein C8J56DRAFT_890341 [Mycena floridula]|nr:hypothetical protein C8J56DRAFT_890341 [Mycena floridula]
MSGHRPNDRAQFDPITSLKGRLTRLLRWILLAARRVARRMPLSVSLLDVVIRLCAERWRSSRNFQESVDRFVGKVLYRGLKASERIKFVIIEELSFEESTPWGRSQQLWTIMERIAGMITNPRFKKDASAVMCYIFICLHPLRLVSTVLPDSWHMIDKSPAKNMGILLRLSRFPIRYKDSYKKKYALYMRDHGTESLTIIPDILSAIAQDHLFNKEPSFGSPASVMFDVTSPGSKDDFPAIHRAFKKEHFISRWPPELLPTIPPYPKLSWGDCAETLPCARYQRSPSLNPISDKSDHQIRRRPQF